MNKIIYFLLLLSSICIMPAVSYSQDKVFLASEDAYVSVLEYTDWTSDNIADYSGKYEFIYPGQTPKGDYEGDIFQDRLLVSFDQGKLNVFKNLVVESDWEMNDTLKNAAISSNQLTATDIKGRYVTLKYNDIKGNVKYSQGLLLENPETKDLSFYEKIKQ